MTTETKASILKAVKNLQSSVDAIGKTTYSLDRAFKKVGV